jgi:hypothetical protein
MAGKPQPVLPRILSKIKKDEITGCWNFIGATIISRGGKGKEGSSYGVTSMNGKHILVHRYMYWHTYLEPQGMALDKNLCVCHSCDNTLCCNPSHLFLGTNQDNSRDASQKGRLQRGEKHTGNRLTEEQVLEIFGAKGTLEEIGDRYGIGKHLVLDIKNQKIWKWLTIGLTPIKENHSRILTKEEVLEIHSSIGTCKSVGEQYGVSPQTVCSIRKGINWSWLTKGKSDDNPS